MLQLALTSFFPFFLFPVCLCLCLSLSEYCHVLYLVMLPCFQCSWEMEKIALLLCNAGGLWKGCGLCTGSLGGIISTLSVLSEYIRYALLS